MAGIVNDCELNSRFLAALEMTLKIEIDPRVSRDIADLN